MKIVVTGGTGFLGKALCKRLAAAQHQVTALGRRPDMGRELEAMGVRFLAIDLEDEAALAEAFEDADAVVHCAALSSAWSRYRDFYRINAVGTQNVCTACLESGVKRLVHISSPSIYFDMSSRLGIKEEDPLPRVFVNDYAKTKYIAETFVDGAAAQGLPCITLRPQAIFGPEDPAIIPRLIRSNGQSGIPVFDGVKVKIDITYVENVVDAIILAIEAPEGCFGKKYNITNGEPIELRPFLQDLFVKLGVPLREKKLPYPLLAGVAHGLEAFHRVFLPEREPLLTTYTLGVLTKSRTLDITAAKRDLKYQPRVSVAEGLDHFIKWWKRKPS